MFNKGVTIIRWEEKVFNKWFWEHWISTCERMMLDPPTHTHTHYIQKLT